VLSGLSPKVRASVGLGRYVASEYDVAAGPVTAWANPQAYTGVIYCGGFGQTATTVWAYAAPALSTVNSLAANWPTGTFDLGSSSHFGNDTSISRLGSAKTFLQGSTSPCRAAAGKVFLVFGSMGGLAAMNYALANLSSVAAIAGIVPVVDLDAFTSNNRGGYKASVDAAYGGTYSAVTHGPTHSPSQYAASLNVPIKLWYAEDDDLGLEAETLAFAAAAPDCTLVSMAGGHTNPTLPSTLQADIAAFLTANAP
jgi:hypothetical protein